ncbi:MAG: MATE family efflux transporter [Vulcanimicrobiota bacterium]
MTDSRSRILGLALPIIGGMVSQNVLNLVDTAMVGTLGNAALAAVGLGGFVTFMSVAFFQGFASSVQAIAARRVGEGLQERAAWPLNGALLMVVALGIPASALLYWLSPWLLALVNSDTQVLAVAVPYYKARVLGVVAIGANFAFRGFWNGTDRSRIYMRTLWGMHALNIVLNYLLIFGKCGLPALGATGAGLATTLALYFGTLSYLVQARALAADNGFLHGLPSRDTMLSLLRLLWPAGLQQFLFATGMTTLYWIVGLVGTAELAATNVLINLLLVVILVEIGFGLSAGALAGQELGRGDPERAVAWGWEVVALSFRFIVPVCLLGLLAPRLVLAPFIHDQATLEMALWPVRIIALTLPFDTFGMVFLHALQGVGDNRRVLLVVIGTQWLFFLPTSYLVGPVLHQGLIGLWLVHAVYRITQAGLLTLLWRGRKWVELRV